MRILIVEDDTVAAEAMDRGLTEGGHECRRAVDGVEGLAVAQDAEFDVLIVDRMMPEPRTFAELVEADLRRASRLIIKVQDEIDPQFRMSTPEGDYCIAITLPADVYERSKMLRRLSTFMAWKQVRAFSMACELSDPDAAYCVGVALNERHHCLVRIRREPRPWTSKNFETIEWLAVPSIDPAIIDLLPRGPRAMTPKEISALQKWFGTSGIFPAVHIPTGEVRGL